MRYLMIAAMLLAFSVPALAGPNGQTRHEPNRCHCAKQGYDLDGERR